jgi:hypothetical protein
MARSFCRVSGNCDHQVDLNLLCSCRFHSNSHPSLPDTHYREWFGIMRPDIEIKLTGIPTQSRGGGNYKGKGRVFMSNYRLVFTPQKPDPRSQLQSFEIPLSCVHNYSFQQPVLGANRLSGKVYEISGGAVQRGSSSISWIIYFNNGGFGTFVPLFYQLATYAARYRPNFESSSTQQQQDEERPTAPPQEDTTTTAPASFFQSALIDPNDPSTIILTQPSVDKKDEQGTYPIV